MQFGDITNHTIKTFRDECNAWSKEYCARYICCTVFFPCTLGLSMFMLGCNPYKNFTNSEKAELNIVISSLIEKMEEIKQIPQTELNNLDKIQLETKNVYNILVQAKEKNLLKNFDSLDSLISNLKFKLENSVSIANSNIFQITSGAVLSAEEKDNDLEHSSTINL